MVARVLKIFSLCMRMIFTELITFSNDFLLQSSALAEVSCIIPAEPSQPPTHPSEYQKSYICLVTQQLKMEDDLTFWGKWKTTLIFLKMEDDLNSFEKGRRPQLIWKWKTTSIYWKWKTTDFCCTWKMTPFVGNGRRIKKI